jgi:hypothetical protein
MSQLFYLGILLIHTPKDDFTVLLYKELRFKLNNFFYVCRIQFYIVHYIGYTEKYSSIDLDVSS